MINNSQTIEDLVHRSMAFELAVVRGLITRDQVVELLTEVSHIVDEYGIAKAWDTINQMRNKEVQS